MDLAAVLGGPFVTLIAAVKREISTASMGSAVRSIGVLDWSMRTRLAPVESFQVQDVV